MHKRKLTTYLGKYIRGFNPDQLRSNILDGDLELRGVELEVAPLNELLAGLVPYTLEVTSATIDHVHVQVPWRTLKSKPVEVQLGHCRICLEVHTCDDGPWAQKSAERARSSLAKQLAAATADGGVLSNKSFSERKVVALDGLRVSVGSLELVLTAAPRPGSCEAGEADTVAVFGGEPPTAEGPSVVVSLADVEFGPHGIGSAGSDRRPGAARVRGATWTTLRRHLALGSLQVRAKSPAGDPRGQVLFATGGVAVECVEWRDASPPPATMATAAAAMLGFPREVRLDVRLPHVELACSHRYLSLSLSLYIYIYIYIY